MEVLAVKRLILLLVLATLAANGCNQDNLQQLGDGQFAEPPQTVSLAIIHYLPATGKIFQDIFVSNFSVRASQAQLLLSSARDGLADGTPPIFNPYATNSGFSNFLLSLMGVTPAQASLLSCATNLQQSSSNDAFIFADSRLPGSPTTFLGLRDCEKSYLGLNPTLFDNNGNGIPDYLKLRCGLNPKDTHDSRLDLTGTGITNHDRCKEHIPIDESANSQPNLLFAYKYQIEVQPDGSQNFNVSNIPILNGGQDNFIAFYVTEVDLGTKAESLYTAFTILNNGSNGATLKFNYWATDPTKYFNQQVVVSPQ